MPNNYSAMSLLIGWFQRCLSRHGHGTPRGQMAGRRQGRLSVVHYHRYSRSSACFEKAGKGVLGLRPLIRAWSTRRSGVATEELGASN